MKRKTNLMHKLFLLYFDNVYMFRAYLAPSSTGIILFRWLSVVMVGYEFQSNHHNRQSSKKNNKYQMFYTYGCTP